MLARIMLYCIFFLLTVVSPAAAEPSTAHNDWVCIPYVRVGPITPATTGDELVRLFGSENVQQSTILVAEGTQSRDVSIVFPETKDELTVFWKDNQYGSAPESVLIRNAGASWTTLYDIRIGTSLERLNQINGRPFWFSGYGWDYGGYIRWDHNGGNLLAAKGLWLRLAPNRQTPRKFYGERELNSSNPELLPDAYFVSTIGVTLAKPSGIAREDIALRLFSVIPELEDLIIKNPDVLVWVDRKAKLVSPYRDYILINVEIGPIGTMSVWNCFLIDKNLNTVLWYDPVKKQAASLEEWRRSRSPE